MSNTQWISVNERLPGGMSQKLIRAGGVTTGLAYLGFDSKWRDPYANCEVLNVTHWMDLPEPPALPADPFEAWWNCSKFNLHETYNGSRMTAFNASQAAWNVAKAHYERPLPDFEAWWKRQPACGTIATIGYHNAKDIWNAAQAKPEA